MHLYTSIYAHAYVYVCSAREMSRTVKTTLRRYRRGSHIQVIVNQYDFVITFVSPIFYAVSCRLNLFGPAIFSPFFIHLDDILKKKKKFLSITILIFGLYRLVKIF